MYRTIGEDKDILNTIHYRPGTLSRGDKTLGRYLEFLREIVTFDFGNSESNDEKVSSILARTIPVSLALAVPGFVLGNLATVFDLPGARLLVDLGHRRSSFCLLLDGRAVAARTVALGGAAFSEGLAKDRGLSPEDAVHLIVNGFCKEVFRELPMEFAVEAQKLLQVSLEGAVG